MDYQSYPPDPVIAGLVKCYWSLEAPAAAMAEIQRIVPDGCMEMIFHFGDLYQQILSTGQSIIQPRAFVFGQITTPLEIMPSGSTGIIAARFHPDGFNPIAGLPITEMENRAVPLTGLFGDEGKELEAAVLAAENIPARIAVIENFLIKRFNSAESINRIAKASVEILMQANGQISVDELAGQVQVNRRQLERKFSEAIGMSPKQLSRILRLQATLKMLQKGEFNSLTALAYQNGYFDQAHFIRDFREFTGMSPSHFFADNLKISQLLLGDE